MVAFIDDHRKAHGVEPICKVLPIAASADHAHVAKRSDPMKLCRRARRDLALTAAIRRGENFEVFGVRKVGLGRRQADNPLKLLSDFSAPALCWRSLAA